MDLLGLFQRLSVGAETLVLCFIFICAFIIVVGLFKKKSSSANDTKGESYISNKVAILFAVLAVIISTVILAYLNKFSLSQFSNDPAAWGQAGDFFGGMLNPILAFSSFIALLYTIRIQSEELRLTREEFAKSAEAQKELVQQAKSQRAHSLLIFTAQEKVAKATEKQLLSMEQQRVSQLFISVLNSIKDAGSDPRLSEEYGKVLSNLSIEALCTELMCSGILDINQPAKIKLLLDYIERKVLKEDDIELLIGQLKLSITPTRAFLLALTCAPFNGEGTSIWRRMFKEHKILSEAILVPSDKGLAIAWSKSMTELAIPIEELGFEEHDFYL